MVHMRLHDKSKCVYCDVCHKAFLTVGALNIHLRIHRGEKPFKCHLCSKCFTQKNHLITHIKRHTKVTDEHFTKKLGPRMFKCEHCPRSFIRLSDYERHVQWNHGAVAEGSIVDKLPTVASLIEGELRQTGLTPQVFKAPKDAMNSRPRVRRPKKVMCTTSTQTDDDGGRVIIPRKYQVSASTQVSAPPTPRREEEMYESDMFDEGMDRNYSSEEEEEEGGEGVGGREDPLEQKVFSLPATSEMASDPIQDAAFDAVVQGRPAKEQQQQQDEHSEFLQEVVNSMARQQQQQQQQQQQAAPPSPPHSQAVGDDSCEMPEIRSVVPTVGRIIIPYKPAVTEHHEPVMKEVLVNPVKVKKEPVGVLPIKLHNPPKRGRGRGRGRGRKWNPYGLTGAAELRAIRMSMMKNIMNNEVAEEEAKLCAKQEGGQVEQAVVVEEAVEGRGKRQAKNKQHGKDFVCTMKNCETCYPQTKARPVTAPQTKTVPLRKAARVVTGSRADSVHGLLSLAGAPPLLRNVKIEQNAPRPEEMKMKVGNRVGSYPVDITANPIPVMRSSGSGSHREDFFVTSSSGESIMSPPVELTSFCIPTYSCKLCSREFRFEGKLHRHIESVHQNKAIFSPDVKPGRGSSRMMPPPGTLIPTHITPTHTTTTAKLGETENPEIAALRSEWDDDEDDPEEVEASQGSVQVSHGSGISMAIVTRDITRSTTTVTDAYSGGVKVNMNKLAGLLPQMAKAIPLGRQGVGMAQEEKDEKVSQSQRAVTREPETITADTLDMKCRRLLEKLFGQELLLQCGLLEEHVSVVLGKVLQHYGVKMIEDYGQGQYEVLKYNLWRLIEWKVTMEQMEEFYTEGKSVEEMMDDIMHDHVPLVSHHYVPPSQSSAPQPTTVTTVPTTTTHVQMQSHSGTLEAVEVSEGQVMLQHVAGMLGSHGISLPDGVTQVVLSQDVTPELLQGAHIVTIDPATGQVLSQVTADQVILADALTDELEQQVSALDGGGQMVVQGAGGQTACLAQSEASSWAARQCSRSVFRKAVQHNNNGRQEGHHNHGQGLQKKKDKVEKKQWLHFSTPKLHM
ncbi:Gastrula zinc finger protein XlCGF67.1 [Chionoecetes opilio]|uniref:Gastrula zinc finger protein XlCGF67.1 n=1 Tax=Chionoecetes opilio TaxID=41210 RepID=A0A8J4Y9M5_CHIOP|nr:Gastrula zinc finger protein XlCGF67.1 [Chionoecetes opilio]